MLVGRDGKENGHCYLGVEGLGLLKVSVDLGITEEPASSWDLGEGLVSAHGLGSSFEGSEFLKG